MGRGEGSSRWGGTQLGAGAPVHEHRPTIPDPSLARRHPFSHVHPNLPVMNPHKVAAIVDSGFEDLELLYPVYRLNEAGYDVDVLTVDGEDRSGKHGYSADPDGAIGEMDPRSYAALLIPGGVESPDILRTKDSAIDFVHAFVQDTDKPIFAICHGPWVLVEADVLDGVVMTSYPSIRRDCENAGAHWVDEDVVRDGRFVTSRHPGDLPEFGHAMAIALDETAGAGAGEASPEEASWAPDPSD